MSELIEYKIHPIAEIFPKMSASEFSALKIDIKERGLLEPIWLYKDKILDGRHRYLACKELGAKEFYREYDGPDPVKFVVSLNLHRRHLDATQRSAIAAELANMAMGHNQHRGSANLQTHQVSQSAAADLLNVSTRQVATAAKVKDEAPEIFDAMKSGNISANLAAQVLDLPEEDIESIESLPKHEMKAAAREAIHNHRAQGTGENEWYTPAQYVESARIVMGGIDIDPASSDLAQEVVKADKYFTVSNDGLIREWIGRVWLNPPYAQPAIHGFIKKTVDEFLSGRMTEGVVLTHNYTDTQWFHLAAKSASAICFTRGRIGFVNPNGKKAAPTQGQAFFYFGKNKNAFEDEFCKFGFIVMASKS